MTGPIRYIFVPLGSAGDVHPLVWLARLMAGRGHEVSVVIQAAMAEMPRRAGLRTLPAGSAAQQQSVARNPDLWHPHRAFRLLARHFPKWAREMIPVIEGEWAPGRTVLVGGGIAFAARMVSERRGLPLVTVHLQPCLFMSPHEAPVLMCGMERLKECSPWLRRLLYGVGYWATDRLLAKAVNRVRREYGSGGRVRGILNRWCLSPDLIMGLFPEWFGPRQPDWPRHAVATRFPLFDEGELRPEDPDLEVFLQKGDAPVLLTPGTANCFARDFFEVGVAACRCLGRRPLLVTPHREHLPGVLPEEGAHFDYVPFSRVFGRCAAVMHHGGIGTCAQGLAAGVPQLVMAMAHDQPDNGWRLRSLGVGDYLSPRRFRVPEVVKRLDNLVSSDAVRRACGEIRDRMASQMPPGQVASLLEHFAQTRLGASPQAGDRVATELRRRRGGYGTSGMGSHD